MNKKFWNERYSMQDYVYGTDPNPSLVQILNSIQPGKILFPAEGEGRNAVFAAKSGWDVYAFDISEAGKLKAENLAEANNASINYTLNSFEGFQASAGYFDCIAFVFTHLPTETRKENFQRLLKFLRPGGTVIVIGFSTQQSGKNSGGPQNTEMLFSESMLRNDFENLTNFTFQEFDTILSEGNFHSGKASLIQFTATK